MNGLPKKLLAADEPAPVSVYNDGGKSPFLGKRKHRLGCFCASFGSLGSGW